MEFFKSGITAIIKRWLKNGCQETPEEINEILTSEYKRREGNLEKNKRGKRTKKEGYFAFCC